MSNIGQDRKKLQDMWKELESPKPPWETFKRLVGFARGVIPRTKTDSDFDITQEDVKKALDLWRRTKDR